MLWPHEVGIVEKCLEIIEHRATRTYNNRSGKMTTKTPEERIAEIETEIAKLKQDLKSARKSKKPEAGSW